MPRSQQQLLEAMVRRVTIEEMWAAGHDGAEIAEALGATPTYVYATMHDMRKSGEWDLPHRSLGSGRWQRSRRAGVTSPA